MTERDQARAAQTKVGRGDWIPRPTKAEVLADVPGARNVKPELLPEGVQHLSNVVGWGSCQGSERGCGGHC
jgi:hypothetical protein